MKQFTLALDFRVSLLLRKIVIILVIGIFKSHGIRRYVPRSSYSPNPHLEARRGVELPILLGPSQLLKRALALINHFQTGFNFVPTLHNDTYPAVSPLQADLTGKVVVVTGASRGIGRATALSYAKAGASGIAILARSDLSSLETELVDAAKKAGRKPELKVLALSGVDTTDRVAVDKAAERAAATFGGKVDVLINNAGYLEEPKVVDKSDPDEWWKTWEVNVKGVYLMSRAFIPLLLKSELKTIVMVSSIGAHLTRPGMSAYQTSKLAVLRLDSFLMEEYGPQGLLVYGIHPGVSGNDCSMSKWLVWSFSQVLVIL